MQEKSLTPRRIRPRDIALLVLAVIAIATALLAAFSAANYNQFYPAMTKFNVQLTSMDWKLYNATTENPTLKIANITFTATNPTGYTGLILNLFKPVLEITSPSQPSIPPEESLGLQAPTRPLEPGKAITLTVQTYTATLTDAKLASQTNDIVFTFNVSFSVGSFLDQAGTINLNYVCATTGGPRPCQQESVSITTTSTGGGGGGG